jgi:peptidoglycan hydrolase-like protein with peptidoglycan-binding domain
MGYTHNKGFSATESGFAVGEKNNEITVIDSSGNLYQAGTQITATAAELNILDDATVTTAELNELDLSAVGAVSKIKKINMTAADFEDNTEVDTGWDLPANAIVKNVFINVNTKEDTATTKTINVGTDGTGSNDPDGFLAGVSVATAGLVKGTLTYNAVTLGELLYTNTGDSSNPVPEPDITSGGESVTVTAGDSGGFTEVDFDILIEYIEVA